MKFIASQKSIFNLLENIRIETNNRVSVSNGKLKNDFGNILYLTNNKTRANQLNNILIDELYKTAEKTIIPPTIISYNVGFSLLASLAKFGYIDTLGVCKYSDEWLAMFLYSLTEKTIPENSCDNIYNKIENKRANLLKDFQNFIKDIILNLKEEELAGLIKDETMHDDVSKMFFDTYSEYKKQVTKLETSSEKFIHSLSAYKYLYDVTTNKRQPFPINKVIVIENYDMLEPIFKKILENIDCSVYIINNEIVNKEKYLDSTTVYNFMTPLDEAEFIGWKVKDLMQQGISSNDICVCCANNKSAEILKTVFERYDIAGEQEMQFAENAYYRLVKTMFNIIYEQEDSFLNLQDIFYNRKSKYMLFRHFFILNNMFVDKGIKTKVNQIESLKETITDFINKYKEQDKYKDSTEKLQKFLLFMQQKNLKITEIANKIINDKKEKQIINEVMGALFEIDENLQNYQKKDYVKNALSLFKILDTREIHSQRKKLFLEVKNEDINFEEEPNYNIEIIKIEKINTIKAKHLFLCGLNASFDKNFSLPYPLKTAKKLNLLTLEQKKLLIAENIIYAINNSEVNYISYPYLSMECKEDGQSTFIKLLLQNPKIKRLTGKDGGLLKSYDVIELKEDKLPDNSWVLKENTGIYQKIDLTTFSDFLFSDMTLDKILKDTLLFEDNGYNIPATDFTDFIMCPRKFVFKLLAKKCNINTKNVDSVINMKRGTFWHRVFELAAQDKNFLSRQENKIAVVLEQALNKAISEQNISIFYSGTKESFINDAKTKYIPLFTKNEIIRQETNETESIYTEQNLKYKIPDTKYFISCRLDRIDKCKNDKFVFFDYKTGKIKTDKISFITKNAGIYKLKNDNHYIQLALYMYIYAHKHNNNNLSAGNIYLNGQDNFNSNGKNVYCDNIEFVLDKIFDFFIKSLDKKIDTLPTEIDINLCDKKEDKCNYCDFKYTCGIINSNFVRAGK